MKRLINWWKKRRAFNDTYTQLSRLTARELRDIGIERTMITRLSLEAAERAVQ